MADLTFSWGFQQFELGDGEIIQRPVMEARLTSKPETPDERSIDLSFLLDSGADFGMIPRAVAEELGVDIERLPVDRTNSVGGQMDVAVATMRVTLVQQRRQFSFNAPFQIPLRAPGYPVVPLMGREPLFRHFDVQFRLSFTEALGKFTLRLVTKYHAESRYRVGGQHIEDRDLRRRTR